MRLVAVALVVVALAACSKKQRPGPPMRCVVKVQLSKVEADATKAPACSATIVAPDTATYADVIAAMDKLATAGFTDFGVGDVVSKLDAPAGPSKASRTTNEGLIIGRFEGVESAPTIVMAKNGDVSVGGHVVSTAGDPILSDKIAAALEKPVDDKQAVVIITGHGGLTYGTVLRVAKAADRAGYAGFLFSIHK
jgi:biopolymer transport protein ExbD